MLSEANLLRVLGRASPETWAEGLQWYTEAREIAIILQGVMPVGEDGWTLDQTAGVLAALSPQKCWGETVRLALIACYEGEARGHFQGQCEKVNRILKGEYPDDVLMGQKERAFFNGLFTGGKTSAVCIDRHAFDVLRGEVGTNQSRKLLYHKGVYVAAQECYRNVAEFFPVYPAQLQAVAWVQWRKEKGLG